MHKLGPGGVAFFSLSGGVLMWECASRFGLLNPVLLPPPSSIAPTLWLIVSSGSFLEPISQTLTMLAIGYGIACVLGISLGLAMGSNQCIYGLFEPLVEVIRPIPKPALIPLLVILLGIGPEMKIFTVALSAFFPILINTIQGVRGTDPVLLGTARTLGLSRFQTTRKIVFFSALPMILAGMRVSLALGLVLVVLAEMLAAETGVGFLILDMQRSFQIRPMYAWIVILALLGMILNPAFEVIEARVLHWRM